MPYTFKNSKGTTYYLHARTTPLKSGKERTLYFFAKEQKEGVQVLRKTGAKSK
jgi:hypothetical protein